MGILKNKFCQRKLICVTLGILFGLLCTYLAASNSAQPIWGTPVMWGIIYNRFLIGLTVAIAGVFNFHPIFGFRVYTWLRGFLFGAVVSIDMAIGVLEAPSIPAEQIQMIFWGTILAGAVYGLIIDVIATRVAGEGKELIGCQQ